MRFSPRRLAALLPLPALLALATASGDTRPHAGMMRYPDVSASHIVFSYANDLWVVPREGGTAIPLASPPGEEAFPRFSPDGKTIAFVGNYDGNRDIYTVGLSGGIPQRLTFHPTAETLTDWSADNRLIYYARGVVTYPRAVELFTLSPEGGMPVQLPVPYGANGAISPDGTWLAYTPHTIDHRTWKRYRGGMQTDIWLFNLKTNESKQITTWEGTDSLPMWQGDTLFYLSDEGPQHRGNIWAYDTRSGQRRQVTQYADFDVKWPAIGPGPKGAGEIVFQLGADLMLLDCATGQARKVEVSIPGDRPRLRPQRRDTAGLIRSADVSPSGKRVAIEARGELYSLPAREGATRNLSRTSGVHERMPSFSPDGKWIAFFADATGEYELYTRSTEDSTADPVQRTRNSKAFYYNAVWSPDSKRIAFADKGGQLYLHTLESGETKIFDVEPWAGQPAMSWSHDSNWLTYTKTGDNQISSIWLYDVAGDAKHQVTSGRFSDINPTFDRKGEFLYYWSQREFSSPTYEDHGTTFIYADSGVMLAVPLRGDVKSPLLPKNDEEEAKKDDKKDEKKDEKADEKKADDAGEGAKDRPASSQAADEKKDDADKADASDKKEEIKPLVIDLAGFERRAIPLPVRRGNFGTLSVNSDGHLLFVRYGRRGSDEQASIRIIDLSADEKEEKTVLTGFGNFGLSADGKKLLTLRGSEVYVVDAKADQKTDKRAPTDGLFAEVDPRAEWAQILREAWRVQRDFFYDPTMHGVDWQKVYEQYAAMLPDCASRDDVGYIIREMISELNVGHAYYFGGDTDSQPSLSVGMLGCDYELANGAYRISRIIEGGPHDSDARGPLSQPGIDVKVGDYLLAVNGAPLDTSRAVWAAFQGLADRTVTLTVSSNPQRASANDPNVRNVVVRCIGDESGLRYRAWIERNRAYVHERTGGKVGYIYVPDTGVNGQNDLFRQFFGQVDKAALIIDERWNGGGQIPTRFIELLNRPVTNYWARRDGNDWRWPPDSHQGPKCMLANGLAGSGGDMFPWLFRYNKLGKIIGTRTWGGLVGISGNPGLIDTGYTSAPTFAFYETDGTWGVEGHGVDPDIEVIDDPAKMVGTYQAVRDPQLDAAIDLMLREIETNGYRPPPRPAYPDRRGMGIAPEDK